MIKIYKWFIWAFFGNDEDTVYGPDDHHYIGQYPKTWVRKVLWWGRNPFHNFTHHVIGLYGKNFDSYIWQFGRFSFILRHYKWIWLPYFKWEGWRWDWYIGWRSSGALGIALRRNN